MKRYARKAALFFFLFFTISSRAQNLDSAIEVRLKLLQPASGGNAITISINNHSSLDIYLPNFEKLMVNRGLHIYEKQETGKYREIELSSFKYFDEYEKEHPSQFRERNLAASDSLSAVNSKNTNSFYYLLSNSIIHLHAPTAIFANDNATTKKYKQHINQILQSQDSLIDTYCQQRKYDILTTNSFKLMNGPVFLKANSVLEIYNIVNVDTFFKKGADYKVAFLSEPRDNSIRYRDSTVEGNPRIFYPEYMLGYKRLFAQNVVSNTIYFSTKESALKRK